MGRGATRIGGSAARIRGDAAAMAIEDREFLLYFWTFPAQRLIHANHEQFTERVVEIVAAPRVPSYAVNLRRVALEKSPRIQKWNAWFRRVP